MQSFNAKRNKFADPIYQLIRQREALRRQRREVVEQLYDLIAEIEGRPARRDNIGFPYSWIISFVQKALDILEAQVRKAVVAVFKGR